MLRVGALLSLRDRRYLTGDFGLDAGALVDVDVGNAGVLGLSTSTVNHFTVLRDRHVGGAGTNGSRQCGARQAAQGGAGTNGPRQCRARFQLQAAARLPNSGISETAVNSALSFIESAQPRDEMECALIIQMACTHSAAMAVAGRIGGAHGGDRHVAMMASAVARLMRTYAFQVETLRRLRSGGSQVIRIERVEVKDGGQAVIGNIKTHRSEPNE